jgi:small conductance mechanosensitive channel
VLLKLILIIAIFGYFGVETTSIAALFAGIGLAIGAMWGGLLGNLSAGAFLVFLRPFKAGDFVAAGDVIGTVKEIGLLVTTIDTMDNVRTYVGNSKILSGNIQNFTTNPYRRVDLKAQLNHGVDHREAVRLLRERLAKVPNVLTDPAPDVEILDFNLAGAVLAVRPYVHNDHYWQVYFDTNRVIRETFGEANFPVPEQHLALRNV